VGFYSTRRGPAATVTLKLKDQILLNEKMQSAGALFREADHLPDGADEHDLRAAISADGARAVAYSPIRLEKETMPSPVVDPPPPAEARRRKSCTSTACGWSSSARRTGDPERVLAGGSCGAIPATSEG